MFMGNRVPAGDQSYCAQRYPFYARAPVRTLNTTETVTHASEAHRIVNETGGHVGRLLHFW
jgi:hypothetical protein